MKFLIFIFLLNFDKSLSESPAVSCFPEKPLLTKDKYCTNFDDICVKKDDADCNNFKSACKQCPASNYSILMFMDIMNVKNQTNFTNYRLNVLEAQLESNKRETAYINKRQKDILILLCIVIVVLVICLVLLICEIRFKLLTKICKTQTRSRGRNYVNQDNENSSLLDPYKQIIDSLDSKFHIAFDKMEILEHKMDSKIDTFLEKVNDIIKENIDSKTNDILKKLDNIIECSRPTTKFVIEDYDKPIIYNLNTEDTVIKIKRELCDHIIKNKNYKLMKMKYIDRFLDDNENLYNGFSSLNATINCLFDTNIDANDILVLKIRGNIDVPNYFQVNKNQTVADLITNLLRMKSILNESKNYKIFKESKELENNYSLKNLNDDDCLYFINGGVEQLELTSIFMESNKLTVHHYPTEKIKQLKLDIADQCSSQPENFFILLKNQYLDENKYLFEYNMDYKGCLQYCCFKKLFKYEKLEHIHKEPLYELFKTKLDNENVLLKKYCLSELKELRDSKYLLKELATFQIIKSKPRFVQLLNIYKDDSNVYAAMKNMEQGTMVNVLEKKQSIENHLIIKWTEQILEGLKFLHDNKIIYRAFNPSCILVNEHDDIKLHGLNLSKYTNLNKISSLMSNFKKEELPIRYLSPEILRDKQYNELTDVWSLGAVLVFIITGKDLYPNIENDAVIDKICNNSNFENQIPDQYKKGKLSNFIIGCLKLDQKDRLSCLKLLKHEFIVKQKI